MITLPISVGALIAIILIATPLLCALTTVLTNRVDSRAERKHLDARRAAIITRENDLEFQVGAVEGREWVVAERENLLQERQLELSRQAHDLDDLVKGQMHLLEDDTTIQNIWDPHDIPTP